jgi:AcrR family transcriptional regulator
LAAEVAASDLQQPSTADPRSDERELLVSAFAKAAAEQGYAGLELADVLRYAGVSEVAFKTHFQTKEQGLIAAQDAFLNRLWLDVIAACDGPAEWPLKVRAAVGAVLGSLVEVSSLARVFTVEATAASLAAAERQCAALDRFATLLSEGRRHFPPAASLPVVTERALVGGIASVVSGHLLMEDPQAIPALEPELVELVLIPYLGPGGAREVALA